MYFTDNMNIFKKSSRQPQRVNVTKSASCHDLKYYKSDKEVLRANNSWRGSCRVRRGARALSSIFRHHDRRYGAAAMVRSTARAYKSQFKMNTRWKQPLEPRVFMHYGCLHLRKPSKRDCVLVLKTNEAEPTRPHSCFQSPYINPARQT